MLWLVQWQLEVTRGLLCGLLARMRQNIVVLLVRLVVVLPVLMESAARVGADGCHLLMGGLPLRTLTLLLLLLKLAVRTTSLDSTVAVLVGTQQGLQYLADVLGETLKLAVIQELEIVLELGHVELVDVDLSWGFSISLRT